jgi:hypothetical protein
MLMLFDNIVKLYSSIINKLDDFEKSLNDAIDDIIDDNDEEDDDKHIDIEAQVNKFD